ncbi:alpha/beta hydrolase [Stieleria varia]|nr:alpha/beta hydrolase-fold protein [Stieleria varia]
MLWNPSSNSPSSSSPDSSSPQSHTNQSTGSPTGKSRSGSESAKNIDPMEPSDAGSDHDELLSNLSATWGMVGETTEAYGVPDSADADSDLDVGSFGWNAMPSCNSFFVPLHYEPKYKYPLVVWLHSDGYNENQVNQVLPHISARNYLAVGVRATRSIDSAGHQFQWHESPAGIEQACYAVEQAIAEASDRFAVHPDRIVLAGYRSGGTMAMRVAMRMPELFAAAISMGGAMPSGGHLFANLNQLRQIRLPMLWQWAIENDQFQSSLLQRDIRSAMMIRARVDIRQYRDDDEMNTVALADVNHWIMDHVVQGIPVGQHDSETSSQTGSQTGLQGRNPWESSPVGFSDN